MIRFIHYQIDLRKLKTVQSKLSANHKLVQSRVSKNGDDDSELSYIEGQEEEIASWIILRKTQYYQHVCEGLSIPMPNSEDEKMYFMHDFDDDHGIRKILTTTGLHSVLNAISDENKTKRGAFGFWFAIVIGFMSVLTSLISVWKQ